jgi:hypothetical protein
MKTSHPASSLVLFYSLAIFIALSLIPIFFPGNPSVVITEEPGLSITAAIETVMVDITKTALANAPQATSTNTQTPVPTVSLTPTHIAPFTVTATASMTASVTSTTTSTEITTEIPTKTPVPYNGLPENAIVAYFVIIGSGGPVGCGDNLIPVQTGHYKTGNIEYDLQVALNFLALWELRGLTANMGSRKEVSIPV